MSQPRNRVRIIGGTWRSRRLRFPDVPGLRPTPDRVRETVFNWLGQDLTGKSCLDLFAGSGALGFEAASRHASRVTMVESDSRAVRAIQDNARELGASAVHVVRCDALEFLRTDRSVYDVVFLDPPYASAERGALLEPLRARMAAGGLLYLESNQPLPAFDGWTVFRAARAGDVHFQLLHEAGESKPK